MCCKGLAFTLLNIENEYVQSALCAYFGVLLAKGACGGVAWVFERAFP